MCEKEYECFIGKRLLDMLPQLVRDFAVSKIGLQCAGKLLHGSIDSHVVVEIDDDRIVQNIVIKKHIGSG